MLSVYPAFTRSPTVGRFPLVFFVRWLGTGVAVIIPVDEVTLNALEIETVFVSERGMDFVFVRSVGRWEPV